MIWINKYNKIGWRDVRDVLISTSLDIMNPTGGVINLINIAGLLKTSRYQVKKCMDSLVRSGIAEYKIVNISSDEECYPPYCGYCLTKTIIYKGGDNIPEGLDPTLILHSRAIYQKRKADENKLIEKCFGVKIADE